MYNYGFRFYDPSIGRFTTVDPMTEQFAHQSGYVYADNDPVGKSDFMGLSGEKVDGDYRLESKGTLTLLRETDDDFDVIYNFNEEQSIQVPKSFMEGISSYGIDDKYGNPPNRLFFRSFEWS